MLRRIEKTKSSCSYSPSVKSPPEAVGVNLQDSKSSNGTSNEGERSGTSTGTGDGSGLGGRTGTGSRGCSRRNILVSKSAV